MKQKTIFACQECGAQSPKWLGRCAECGAWNSLVEERAAAERAGARPPISRSATAWRRPRGRSCTPTSTPWSPSACRPASASSTACWAAASSRDRSCCIGGEPGIGKSTLLLQAAAHFATDVGPVLYSSGEESEHQIKSRGERLGVGAARRSTSSRRHASSGSSRRSRG